MVIGTQTTAAYVEPRVGLMKGCGPCYKAWIWGASTWERNPPSAPLVGPYTFRLHLSRFVTETTHPPTHPLTQLIPHKGIKLG